MNNTYSTIKKLVLDELKQDCKDVLSKSFKNEPGTAHWTKTQTNIWKKRLAARQTAAKQILDGLKRF